MLPVFKKVVLPRIDATKFIMNPVELKDVIDYEAKRIYYITEPKSPTGAHCHRIEKEFFVMVAGSCVAEIDQGKGLEQIPLQGPSDAMYVGNYVWHHFKDFAPGSILLAISSTNYSADRSDYIMDYGVYQAEVRKQINQP